MKRYFTLLLLSLFSLLTLCGCQPAEKPYTVTGTVDFPEYKQGIIHIAAFSSPDFEKENRITFTNLDKPESFTLTIPSDYPVIYMIGYNDADADGPPNKKTDPRFRSRENPILLEPGKNVVEMYSYTLAEKKEDKDIL